MVFKEAVFDDFFNLMEEAYPRLGENRTKAVEEVREKLIAQHGADEVPSQSYLYRKHTEYCKNPPATTPTYAAQQAVLREKLKHIDTEQFYTSLSEIKPLALIISNYKFNGNAEEREKYYRKGTKAKNWNWKSHLEYLGYEVLFRKNLNAEEMKKELENFYLNPKHEKASRAIIYISSHGLNGITQGVDWNSVFIDDIRTSFGAVHHLRNKLKLLFLSSCRDFTDKKNPIQIPAICQTEDSRVHYDLLTLYSTVEFHSSARGFSVVGMIMWKLLEESKTKAYTADFEEVIRGVKKYFVDKFVPMRNAVTNMEEREVVCGETVSTLIKKFYLPVIPM